MLGKKKLGSILNVFTKTLKDLEDFIEKEGEERNVQLTKIDEATRRIDESTLEINKANAVKRKLNVLLNM